MAVVHTWGLVRPWEGADSQPTSIRGGTPLLGQRGRGGRVCSGLLVVTVVDVSHLDSHFTCKTILHQEFRSPCCCRGHSDGVGSWQGSGRGGRGCSRNRACPSPGERVRHGLPPHPTWASCRRPRNESEPQPLGPEGCADHPGHPPTCWERPLLSPTLQRLSPKFSVNGKCLATFQGGMFFSVKGWRFCSSYFYSLFTRSWAKKLSSQRD